MPFGPGVLQLGVQGAPSGRSMGTAGPVKDGSSGQQGPQSGCFHLGVHSSAENDSEWRPPRRRWGRTCYGC